MTLNFYFYLTLILAFLAFLIFSFAQNKKTPQNKIVWIFYFLILLTPIKLMRLIPIITLLTTPTFLQIAKNNLKNSPIYQIFIKSAVVFISLILLFSITQRQTLGNTEYKQIIFYQGENNQSKPVGSIDRIWNTENPKLASDFIKNNLETKRLFTSTNWNNYFVWQNPQVKVFADALFYNRDNQDYEDEDKINNGQGNWQELIDNYQIDTIVIPQIYFPIQTPAQNLKLWQLVYIDGVSRVYARESIIKNKVFDFSIFKPEIFEKQKFKKEDSTPALKTLNELLTSDDKNSFARTQLIEYYLESDIQKAKKLTEESRLKSPNDPYYSLDLARIYAKENNCSQALEFAQEAKQKSYNDFFLNLEVKNALTNCQSTN